MAAMINNAVSIDMKAAALWYARKGLAVFPVHSIRDGRCTCKYETCTDQGKHPILSGGFKSASVDLDQVAAWWTKYPWANIGMATGRVSGVDVIDIDPRHGGDDQFDRVRDDYGDIDETWTCLTGGGGQHIYVKYSGLPTGSDRIGRGVDIRGDGGYVLVPPSSHISGHRYEWEASSEPFKTPLAEFPAKWRPLVSGGRKPAQPVPGDAAANAQPLPLAKQQEIRDALAFIPADDRDVWKDIGMALHAASVHPSMFQLWDSWAQKSDKYDADDQRRVWASFRSRPDGLKLGTLFRLARGYGWDGGRPTPPPIVPAPEQAPAQDNGQPAPAAPVGRTWRDDLITKETEQGQLTTVKCAANFALILERDPRWEGVLSLDEFSHRIVVRKTPPIHYKSDQWMDRHVAEAKRWLEENEFRSNLQTAVIAEAIDMVAARNPSHQIRDYLDALEWDGRDRVHLFLSDAMGVELNEYTRAVSHSFLISACARAYDPGCKVDTTMVIEGGQGLKKTTVIETLFSKRWYAEVSASVSDKDFYQNLRGKWCLEFGDLKGLSGADRNHLKQILTARVDTYRASYARTALDFPRQNIFIATTNDAIYLNDPTGARRFLPVVATAIDLDYVRIMRDQIWAEAAARYKRGEPWWEIPAEDAAMEQSLRYEADPWADLIIPWLDGERLGAGEAVGPDEFIQARLERRDFVTVSEVLSKAVGLAVERHDPKSTARVVRILRESGWIGGKNAKVRRVNGRVTRGWSRG